MKTMEFELSLRVAAPSLPKGKIGGSLPSVSPLAGEQNICLVTTQSLNKGSLDKYWTTQDCILHK